MYGYGGIIIDGTEVFKAAITLKHTKVTLRNPVYFRTFGDGIFNATFVVHKDVVTVGMTMSSLKDFDLGVKDQQTGVWKGFMSYADMEEFLEYWNILDRMVLIEKIKL